MIPACSICHEPVNVAKGDIRGLLKFLFLQHARICVDVVIFDVHDELGQRLEVQSAAPELTDVGEEGGGGDACHGLRYIEVVLRSTGH